MELFQDKKDKKDCTLDMGRGCEFCGCGGEELSAGVCEGCFKLHVTDWPKDYPDTLPGDIYEVRVKNTRHIGEIMLSESYYEDVGNGKYPGLTAVSEPAELLFDEEGNLADGM